MNEWKNDWMQKWMNEHLRTHIFNIPGDWGIWGLQISYSGKKILEEKEIKSKGIKQHQTTPGKRDKKLK